MRVISDHSTAQDHCPGLLCVSGEFSQEALPVAGADPCAVNIDDRTNVTRNPFFWIASAKAPNKWEFLNAFRFPVLSKPLLLAQYVSQKVQKIRTGFPGGLAGNSTKIR